MKINVQVCLITRRGPVTDKFVDKLTIMGSDNDLSPEWRLAIIWISVVILLIGPLGMHFSGILIRIQAF